jgi:50S ribosomal subunit-associated GTPase HflX
LAATADGSGGTVVQRVSHVNPKLILAGQLAELEFRPAKNAATLVFRSGLHATTAQFEPADRTQVLDRTQLLLDSLPSTPTRRASSSGNGPLKSMMPRWWAKTGL